MASVTRGMDTTHSVSAGSGAAAAPSKKIAPLALSKAILEQLSALAPLEPSIQFEGGALSDLMQEGEKKEAKKEISMLQRSASDLGAAAGNDRSVLGMLSARSTAVAGTALPPKQAKQEPRPADSLDAIMGASSKKAKKAAK